MGKLSPIPWLFFLVIYPLRFILMGDFSPILFDLLASFYGQELDLIQFNLPVPFCGQELDLIEIMI